ncbi:MAG: hypothetical protein ACFCUH_03240 [Flavobacteriales bacterium]
MMKHHVDPFFESVRTELYAMEVVPPAGIQGKVMSRLQPARSPWLLNSVAALLICATGVGIASWQHTTGNSTAMRSYEAKPILDAALNTAQTRIVEREYTVEESSPLASVTASSRRVAISPARVRQAAVVAPAVELPQPNPTVEQPLSELPKAVAATAVNPVQQNTLDNQTAPHELTAADILKQAENADNDVIRMSVKVTVPVDDKE